MSPPPWPAAALKIFPADLNIWIKSNRWAILPALPLLIFWGFWFFNPAFWFTADPAAQYFLDSLALFAGKPYLYVDHPGTPVSLLGSLLLGLTYPLFGSPERLISYYIAEPETFFVMANLVLLAMNLLTVFWFFRTVTATLKEDQILAGAALSLMFFGIHPQGFSSLTYWSHNSFNFIFGTLWLLWLVHEAQQPIQPKKLFLLGFTAGALSMTQLYLLIWLAGGAFTVFMLRLCSSKSPRLATQDSLIFSFAGILGILLLLLPAYKALPNFIAWIKRLVDHQGLYGAGEPGIYSLDLLPRSLAFWAQYAPLLTTALALSLLLMAGALWVATKNQRPLSTPNTALLTGLVVQMLLLIVILSKMFYRLRYVLSLAALLPILLFLAIQLTEQAGWQLRWPKRLLYTGLLISTLVFMGQEIVTQRKHNHEEQEAALARSQVITILAKQRNVDEKSLSFVYAWGTPLKCAGLLMANNWIRAFDQELAGLCPNQYALYDFAYDTRLNTPYPIPTIDQIDWDVVVWPGNGSNLPEYLASVGAKTIPNSWGVIRAKWFYLRPEK